MIAKELARSGLPVLKKDGRFVDSSIDPMRDALAWVEKNLRGDRGADLSVDQFIVLGLGSGYHVDALLAKKKANQAVLVIDSDEELVGLAKTICPHLVNCEIVVESDWTRLVRDPRFCDAVGSVYKICVHGPSLQINPEYYRAVESLLLGREKFSFLHLLKARPDLTCVFSAEGIANLPSDLSPEAVSLRTICRLFADQAFASRERRLWRVLEELVV